jgi:hypothetical protein
MVQEKKPEVQYVRVPIPSSETSLAEIVESLKNTNAILAEIAMALNPKLKHKK